MTELRVALIVLGAVFLAVLLLWERRRSVRRGRSLQAPEHPQPTITAVPPATLPARGRRLEPSIEDFSPGETELPESLDVPTIHPVDPVRVEVMREVAVDVPSAAMPVKLEPVAVAAAQAPEAPPAPPAVEADSPPEPPVIRWPPARTERVLSVRVVRANGSPLAGRTLRQALESAGMLHGPQRIYHLVDADGIVRASAANLVRPGSFDPALMDAQEFRGLSLFSILPGPVAAARMFDDLLELAHAIAVRVEAVVQDEQGAALAGERLAQLRRSLAPQAPDGTPA
jgi:FtsZ-interacting cell division protein ZipA